MVGTPADPPALVARGGRLWASWNGATEVSAWQLLEGANAASPVQRTGFETVLTPVARTHSAAVVALDRAGASLGRSATVAL